MYRESPKEEPEAQEKPETPGWVAAAVVSGALSGVSLNICAFNIIETGNIAYLPGIVQSVAVLTVAIRILFRAYKYGGLW